jgi:hypothetical protein
MFGKRSYSANFVSLEGKSHLFRVTELEDGKVLRSFLALVSPEALIHPNVNAVKSWFEKNQDKLPVDGGTVLVDLANWPNR